MVEDFHIGPCLVEWKGTESKDYTFGLFLRVERSNPPQLLSGDLPDSSRAGESFDGTFAIGPGNIP